MLYSFHTAPSAYFIYLVYTKVSFFFIMKSVAYVEET